MLNALHEASRPALAFADRLARARDGVSAVEFGLIAPLLVLMFLGSLELSGAITASNRSTFVADSVGEMVSRVDHTVSDDELRNFAITSALIDPDIVKYARTSGKEIDKAFKITISSVQFEPGSALCGLVPCNYEAKVVFSYTMNGTKRPCGKISSSSTNKPSNKTLPADVYGPGSLIVVDVETYYSPIMPVRFTNGPVTYNRSSYFRPRYVSRVLSNNNCSGF